MTVNQVANASVGSSPTLPTKSRNTLIKKRILFAANIGGVAMEAKILVGKDVRAAPMAEGSW